MRCYFYFVYSLLDLRSSECDVVSLYFLCCSVNVPVSLVCCSVNEFVCLVCCVFDSVCELFSEIIRNVFGCGCCFVAECYGCVYCGWRCSVG